MADTNGGDVEFPCLPPSIMLNLDVGSADGTPKSKFHVVSDLTTEEEITPKVYDEDESSSSSSSSSSSDSSDDDDDQGQKTTHLISKQATPTGKKGSQGGFQVNYLF